MADRLEGLNNLGDCVDSYSTPSGHQHAWIYSAASDSDYAVDLNDLGVNWKRWISTTSVTA